MNRVKIFLFFTWAILHQNILIIEKNTLVLAVGPAAELNDTTIIAEDKYLVDIIRAGKKICLNLQIYQWKLKTCT